MASLAMPGKERQYRNFCFFLLGLFIVTLLLRAMIVPYHIADFVGGDMNVVYGIQRLLSGQELYLDPTKPPYAVIQYSPLYYHLCAVLARFRGLGPDDIQPIYELTRIVNILCNLGTVLLVAMSIRLWQFKWKESLFFALPVFMIPTVHYYGRCDSLHLLFFVAAIYVTMRYLLHRSWHLLLLAALFSACCVMSKQNGVLTMLVIGSYLLLVERKLVAALVYGFAALSFAALILFAGDGTNWVGFYQNAYLGLKNGVDYSYVYTIFISQFYYDFIPFYFLGGLMVNHAFKKQQDTSYRFVAYSVAFSFLFAVITGLKIGSSNNYFTEFLVIAVAGVPFLLRDGFAQRRLFRLGKANITVRRFAFIALFILTASKTMGFFTSIFIEKRIKDHAAAFRSQQDLYCYFRDTLLLKEGAYVYVADKKFFDNIFFRNGIFPSKDVVSQVYLSNPGTYDYSDFLKGMNNGLVKYVVTPREDDDMNRYGKELLPFIALDESRFEKIADRGDYLIYRFRQQL